MVVNKVRGQWRTGGHGVHYAKISALNSLPYGDRKLNWLKNLSGVYRYIWKLIGEVLQWRTLSNVPNCPPLQCRNMVILIYKQFSHWQKPRGFDLSVLKFHNNHCNFWKNYTMQILSFFCPHPYNCYKKERRSRKVM